MENKYFIRKMSYRNGNGVYVINAFLVIEELDTRYICRQVGIVGFLRSRRSYGTVTNKGKWNKFYFPKDNSYLKSPIDFYGY